MLPKDLMNSIGGLNNLKGEDLKQAEHIWKMLDSMADSNYEEYKQFVSKQINEGFDKIKDEKTQKINQEKIVPKPGVLLKLRAKLQEFILKEKDEKLDFLEKKFTIEQKKQDDKKEYIKSVKIYLNICFSDTVLQAHDAQNKEVIDFSDPSRIWKIPFSLTEGIFQKETIFFDSVINEKAFMELIQKNPKTKMATIGYFINIFQERIKRDKNPILTQQIQENSNKNSIFYYEIEKNSIVLHSKKNYKGPGNKTTPEKVNLEAGTKIGSAINTTSETKKQQEIRFSEPKPPQIQENSTPKINIPGTNLSSENKKKGPLIQEIPDNASSKPEKPAYDFREKDDCYDIEFLLPLVSKFSEIGLDVSGAQLKLEIPGKYSELLIEFRKKVNNENVKAKWISKSKKLHVTVPII